MIKRIFIIFAVLIPQIGYSMRFSFITGGCFSKYYPTSADPKLIFHQQPNLFIGFEILFPISQQFQICTGALFGSRGSKAMISESKENSLHADYKNFLMQFPIVIKTQLGKKTPFYLLGGPRIDFFFSHQLKIHPDEIYHLQDKTNIIALDLDLGIGYSFRSGLFSAYTEIRYSKGLTSILAKDSSGYGISMDAIQLGFGIYKR